ncbi:hypothetical protein L9F63_020186 [Diploptera punctata]|uniref:Uncharacterized protein n=1 Tax=Diploptera punctata TaxID=6984 RepID=A0AAD7ZSM9_DIPPU|nr:hypothetical protein L9F63_020186 [Diploptera punctata]
MTSTVNKVPDGENTNEQLIMMIDWKDDSFDILLMQKQLAWIGTGSCGHVKQLCQFVDMTVQDYMNETKTALSTLGGLAQFSYHVLDNQFIWKKVIQDDIKIRFGYVPLIKIPYAESSGKVLDALMQQNCSLRTEVDGLQKANKRSTSERVVLMEKLVEYKKQKLEMERTLYSQFVAVLNKKKHVLQQVHSDNGINDDKAASSTVNSNSDHYDSDTEVENTDNEDKNSTGKLSDEELFETDGKPTTAIPRRVGRQKRISEQSRDKPGPSNKKQYKPKEMKPLIDTTDTQDLWDEL